MDELTICPRCGKKTFHSGACSNCHYTANSDNTTSKALQSGTVLGSGNYSYEIIDVLGSGGYGITYIVKELSSRSDFVIKEFFPNHAVIRSTNGRDVVLKNKEQSHVVEHEKKRFREEAQLLNRLKDFDEIVQAYRYFEQNNTAYYVMELLHGTDLQHYLRENGKMTWKQMRPVAISIMRALYATHNAGYIHRDVTPDNIFMLSDGKVKLIDFGNARAFHANEPKTAIVKPKFAPFEQYSQYGHQGPWTDIYSLSVTIYYAMTDVLPPMANEKMILPLPSLAEVCPDTPLSVSKAVGKGMNREEAKRFSNIPDFSYAMFPEETILAGIDISVKQPQSSVRPPISPKVTKTEKIASSNQHELCAVEGVMVGKRYAFTMKGIITIGRKEGKTILYPEGARDVSHSQCSLYMNNTGKIFIRDDSRFGTFLNNARLTPNVWEHVNIGDTISFGHNEIYFIL